MPISWILIPVGIYLLWMLLLILDNSTMESRARFKKRLIKSKEQREKEKRKKKEEIIFEIKEGEDAYPHAP